MMKVYTSTSSNPRSHLAISPDRTYSSPQCRPAILVSRCVFVTERCVGPAVEYPQVAHARMCTPCFVPEFMQAYLNRVSTALWRSQVPHVGQLSSECLNLVQEPRNTCLLVDKIRPLLLIVYHLDPRYLQHFESLVVVVSIAHTR